MTDNKDEASEVEASPSTGSDDVAFDEQLAIERRGARASLNPMFGEWQHHFRFAPVPYGNGAARRGEFRRAIQAECNTRWLFSSEIQIEITLRLDVQTVLETDETADLDNYAKSILDGLKGPSGIMIDDTQVQSLTISWLDGRDTPSFTVAARGLPDDFVLKPQEFYEMPDGLWYPHGRVLWTEGQAEAISDLDHYVGLSIIEQLSSLRTRIRAGVRRNGASRRRAYNVGQYGSTSARGFHRSRVLDSFPLHPRREWQAQRAQWIEIDNVGAEVVEKVLQGMRTSHNLMLSALTGE